MEVLGFVGMFFGVIGVLCAAWFYRELVKWNNWARRARIVVAYKRKTVLQAPMTEFVAWADMLDKDKDSQGRVIYRQGGTSIAIAKAVIPPSKLRRKLSGKRNREQKDHTTKPNNDKVLGVPVSQRERRDRNNG